MALPGNLAGLALSEPAPGRDSLVHAIAAEDHVYDSESKGETGSGLPDYGHPVELAYPGNNGASLEEYMYWARVQREEERQDEINGVKGGSSSLVDVFLGWYRKSSFNKRRQELRSDAAVDYPAQTDENGFPVEKKDGKPETLTTDLSTPQLEGIHSPKILEGLTTARAMRMAGATSVFFLITTDILGPSSAPYGMSQNGWAQGNILFFFFGAAASMASYAIQWLFLRLDSSRFPVKTYGDIGHRLMGPWMRHLISFLQFLQLIVNCALLVLGNGQALVQIINQYVGNYNRDHPGQHRMGLCFTVAVLIFAGIGMALAQVRALRGLGLLANMSAFLNWAICIISMVVIQTKGYSAETVAAQLGTTAAWVNARPAQTSAWAHIDLFDQIQGVNLLVFAYGGAMIFPELLSEMKQPKSFWKGCCLAQLIIYIVYVVYACVIYDKAGQYSLSIGYQIMATGAPLTVCNVFSIVTAIVAAAIYGNVGLKVSYVNLIEDVFKGPSVYTRGGRIVWLCWSIVFWAVAYVIASAVPQINSLSGLISAIAIVNFSYTFPFLFVFIWLVHADAMAADGEWTPYSGPQRIDSWTSPSRLYRGLFSGWYRVPGTNKRIPGFIVKGFVCAVSMGGLTMSGLGLYGAGLTAKTSFDAPGAISTSFGCSAPV